MTSSSMRPPKFAPIPPIRRPMASGHRPPQQAPPMFSSSSFPPLDQRHTTYSPSALRAETSGAAAARIYNSRVSNPNPQQGPSVAPDEGWLEVSHRSQPPPKPPVGASGPVRLSTAGNKAWSSLFSVGRIVDDTNKCSSFPLKYDDKGKAIGVDIPKDSFAACAKKWSNTLVGYVVGNRPFYSHLRACVHRLWRPKGNLTIHSRENGFFFFAFELDEDCQRVLQEGPWLFDKRIIVLRQWTADLTLDRDLLSSVPVWTRFPHLPLSLWSTENIGRIASFIGKPLYVDSATANGDRFTYARCFVEIDASKTLPNSIDVFIEEGNKLSVAVEYENIPPRCPACVCFGHSATQCTFKKIWVAKEPVNPSPATHAAVVETPIPPNHTPLVSPNNAELAANDTSGVSNTVVAQAMRDNEATTGEEHNQGGSMPATSQTMRGDEPNHPLQEQESETSMKLKEKAKDKSIANSDYGETGDDASDEEYGNDWSEEFDEDLTMANPAYEEEMKRLAAVFGKKKQMNLSLRPKSARSTRNPKYR